MAGQRADFAPLGAESILDYIVQMLRVAYAVGCFCEKFAARQRSDLVYVEH